MDTASIRDAFARTYSPPRDLDPLELLEDYQRFTEYRAENPEAGRYKTANAVGIPKGRARSWIDGSKPDVVRGTEVAERYNWFTTSGETHLALTRLVAGIFAAGSINEHWTPRWSADDSEPFEQHLQTIGTGVARITRDNNQNGNEIEPNDHARVLGRVLAARGAPRAHVSEYTIPSYLFDDDAAGDAFVDVFIVCRGVVPAGRDHRQIYEQNRSEQYYDNLARLAEQHVDGDVTRAKHGIRIYPEDERLLA